MGYMVLPGSMAREWHDSADHLGLLGEHDPTASDFEYGPRPSQQAPTVPPVYVIC